MRTKPEGMVTSWISATGGEAGVRLLRLGEVGGEFLHQGTEGREERKRGREEERKRGREEERKRGREEERKRVRDFVAALRHPLTLAAGPLQATETQEPKAPVFASPAPLQASLRGAGNAKTQR